MAKHLWEAVATLIGCSIGAGILGIPYVVSQSGFGIGLLNILVIGAALLVVNLMLGEVILRTTEKHQLIGYADKYLGKPGRIIMIVAFVLAIYGALLAYTAVEGEVLADISGLPAFWLSLAFFCIMAFLIHYGISVIEKSELFLSGLKIFIFAVMIVLIIASGKADLSNIHLGNAGMLFLPYGVILFAFLADAVIPEMREELEDDPASLKKAILAGGLISIAVYVLFAFAVVAVNGLETSPVAPIGLGNALGKGMLILSNLFAVFAMATSFLALGTALKEMYIFDFKLNRDVAWLLTCIVPLGGFLLGFTDFIEIIGLVGALAGGINGGMVVLMHWRSSRISERQPEYTMPRHVMLTGALLLLFAIGIIQQII